MEEQNRKTLFADIILPLPVAGTFTYRVPYELNDAVKIGQRVVVPFGKSKIMSGLIFNLHENVPQDFVPKYINEILDEQAIVNKIQFQFWNWISQYYMCHLGEIMQSALPAALRLSSETTISLSPDFIPDTETLTDNEYIIVEALSIQSKLAISEVNKIVGFKKIMPLIKSMIDKHIIVLEEELNEKYKARYERFIKLDAAYADDSKLGELMDSLSKRAYKQLEVLLAFITLHGSAETDILLREVIKKAQATSSVVKTMADKGIFEVYEKKVSRLKKFDAKKEASSIELSEAQSAAFNSIKTGFADNKTVLLHGVTSSGKTELYIKLIQETLDQGRQVLYLLPEIALTEQIINRLKEYFGEQAGVYHSRYGDKQRVEVWQQVVDFEHTHNKQHQIIIGSRSALFLPYSQLGLIIVDEEHDSSFKQVDPAPRYNARDAAIVLASLHHANIVLGSATPSYESFFNALTQKYHLVQLSERYGGVEMPEIIISDLRIETHRKTMHSHFSSLLIETLKETLADDKQAILFQNRRGFSLHLECSVCNWIPQCANCDVSLVYHKKSNLLRCHYCGYTIPVPTSCPSCHSTNLIMQGFGTEKVEEDLQLILPETKIARLDLDTTRTKNSYHEILENFKNKTTQILVGTQMVTKGLDFDSVKTVGILNADSMLSFPDFRAFERSFQMMAQVSGRAGRKGKRGKVIIQTYQPTHPVLIDVINNNYEGLFQQQMNIRKQYGYPPFFRLILIRLKHVDYEKLNLAATELNNLLRPVFKNFLLGPEYPVVSRIKNQYIKQFIVKFNREESSAKIKELIQSELDIFRQSPNSKSVTIQIDVDPN